LRRYCVGMKEWLDHISFTMPVTYTVRAIYPTKYARIRVDFHFFVSL
jgi:hypothetical protein